MSFSLHQLQLHQKWHEAAAFLLKNYMSIRPEWGLIKKILLIGIPSGIENSMFQFGKLAIQSTVSTMGRIAISAQAMTNILEMVNGVAGMGIGIGLMTVVGQCIGAGRKEEAKYYIVKLTGYAWVAVILSCLFVLAIVKPVTMLAGLEPDSAALCIQMVIAITIVKPIFWTFSFIPAYGMRAVIRFPFVPCGSCGCLFAFFWQGYITWDPWRCGLACSPTGHCGG